MQDNIFRMYDIRGKVGTELCINDVYSFAHALGFYYKQQAKTIQTIVVGMDERDHSVRIKDELVRGLRESGFDIIDIGVCPSPVLYFAQYYFSVDAALMITASHNPKEYNGIKMCRDKKPIWGSEIQKILNYFKDQKKSMSSIEGAYKEAYIIDAYTSYLKNSFPHLVGVRLNTVFDCGNASTGAVLPMLIESMEWKDTLLLCGRPDRTLATHQADPTDIANMRDVQEVIVKNKALIGIAFDGDGDRMGALTDKGEIVSGDILLSLYAKYILKNNPKATIVSDIKCSNVLYETIKKYDGVSVVSPSGHSYIKESVAQHNALLAGELSCHFFFKDKYFGFDDGIYAALRLLEIVIQSKKTMTKLLEEFMYTIVSPEIRIPCKKKQGNFIVDKVKQFFSREKNSDMITVDGVRIQTEYGWGLIRASNTQDVVSLRFEGKTAEELQKIQYRFIEAMQPYFDESIKEKLLWHDI